MIMHDEMNAYRCPRWHQLPDLALYMDQVVAVLEKHLSPLNYLKEERMVTATMINNYVKCGLIPPPEKKRYSREHLAMLCICIVLKQILSLSDLDSLLRYLRASDSMETIYDRFCEELEHALHSVFSQGVEPLSIPESTELQLLRSLSLAYALQLYSRSLIAACAPKREECSDPEPQKKKKQKKKDEESDGGGT